MTTKQLLNNLAAHALGDPYQEEIRNMYQYGVDAGKYSCEEQEYRKATTHLLSTLSQDKLRQLSEYESLCVKIREFSAAYGFQSGLLCGFKQFFTADRAEDGGFFTHVSKQIAMMPNMRTYTENYGNILRCNAVRNGICQGEPDSIHECLLSIEGAWNQRIYSASIDGFYCGYRGAMAIIDMVMLPSCGSSSNISKTITMEHTLGYIRSFSELERDLE